MSAEALDLLPEAALREALTRCCGAHGWVDLMVEARPYGSQRALAQAADDAWAQIGEADYLEAFSHHPRIGDLDGLRARFSSTRAWAGDEQAGAAQAGEATLTRLRDLNDRYFERFGFIFIVCATGKSAAEMLALLEARLPNDRGDELVIAAAEQHKITHIRLEKL